MFERDYIMRLIHEIVRALLKLLFNIDANQEEEQIITTQADRMRYDELLDLIDKGEINEAENRLLDELDPEEVKDYKTALLFYSYLNEKDVDFLEEHQFSKGEIIYGLKYVSSIYGYGSLAEVLLGITLE